ncbi:hypothetical protein ACLMJK_008813 [Lecanora helva]
MSVEPPLSLPSLRNHWSHALTLPPTPRLSLLRRLLRSLTHPPSPSFTGPLNTLTTFFTTTTPNFYGSTSKDHLVALLYLDLSLTYAHLGEYYLATLSLSEASKILHHHRNSNTNYNININNHHSPYPYHNNKNTQHELFAHHATAVAKAELKEWRGAGREWRLSLQCFLLLGVKQIALEVVRAGGETDAGRQMQCRISRDDVETNLRVVKQMVYHGGENRRGKVGICGIPTGMAFGPDACIMYDEGWGDTGTNGGAVRGVERGEEVPRRSRTEASLLPLPLRTKSTTKPQPQGPLQPVSISKATTPSFPLDKNPVPATKTWPTVPGPPPFHAAPPSTRTQPVAPHSSIPNVYTQLRGGDSPTLGHQPFSSNLSSDVDSETESSKPMITKPTLSSQLSNLNLSAVRGSEEAANNEEVFPLEKGEGDTNAGENMWYHHFLTPKDKYDSIDRIVEAEETLEGEEELMGLLWGQGGKGEERREGHGVLKEEENENVAQEEQVEGLDAKEKHGKGGENVPAGGETTLNGVEIPLLLPLVFEGSGLQKDKKDDENEHGSRGWNNELGKFPGRMFL